jgi:hypothetical protein
MGGRDATVSDRHGDSRPALWAKAPTGEQQALVGADPSRYPVHDGRVETTFGHGARTHRDITRERNTHERNHSERAPTAGSG